MVSLHVDSWLESLGGRGHTWSRNDERLDNFVLIVSYVQIRKLICFFFLFWCNLQTLQDLGSHMRHHLFENMSIILGPKIDSPSTLYDSVCVLSLFFRLLFLIYLKHQRILLLLLFFCRCVSFVRCWDLSENLIIWLCVMGSLVWVPWNYATNLEIFKETCLRFVSNQSSSVT